MCDSSMERALICILHHQRCLALVFSRGPLLAWRLLRQRLNDLRWPSMREPSEGLWCDRCSAVSQANLLRLCRCAHMSCAPLQPCKHPKGGSVEHSSVMLEHSNTLPATRTPVFPVHRSFLQMQAADFRMPWHHHHHTSPGSLNKLAPRVSSLQVAPGVPIHR